MAFPAKFPGRCSMCRRAILVGDPIVYQNNRTVHSTCAGEVISSERSLSLEGVIRMPYDPDAIPTLRGAPGARWVPAQKYWTISVLDKDLPRSVEVARKLRLAIAPELIARLEAGTVETRAAQSRVDQIEERSGQTLYPFQRVGVDWLSRHPRALLADDMGLGKTIQTLAALPSGARALVICPALVKSVWQIECQKWRPDLTPVVLSGKKSFRFPEPGELVIVNYDILLAQPTAVPEGVSLVVDEAHSVKNYKAKRSKAVKLLGQAIHHASGTVWYLTGTPLVNRPQDLFGVLDCLGERVLGDWFKFVALFHGYKNRWNGWEFGAPEPEVAERLRRIMIRRRRAEVLPDLPQKIRQNLFVNGVDYDSWDELATEWGEKPSELPPFTEFSAALSKLAESRIPAMTEYIRECEEQSVPLVVFSAHRAPIDVIDGRAGWRTITGDTSLRERQEIIEAFQAGKLLGVALTIQAGGVGITLTRASHVLFVDRDWTPALNMQAEDRLCRIGQTASSVQVVVMRSSHPLCQHLEELIEMKIALIEAAVEREQGALSLERIENETKRLEALQARAELVEREARRIEVEDHMRRIESRAEGIARRAEGHQERELSPELVALLHQQIESLYAVCDGAQLRDGEGFSKVDVSLGWSLARLEEWTPDQARCAERLTIIYRRQLCDQCPPTRRTGS